MSANNQPPMIGAIAGATPKNRVIWLIKRCACPPYRGHARSARPTTTPAPQLIPWRRAGNECTDVSGGRADQAGERERSQAPSMIGRRPKLSDNAPCNSIITEKPIR